MARVQQAMTEWSASHPFPLPSDSVEKRAGYYRARLSAAGSWKKLAPQEPFVALDRAMTLAELSDSSEAEFLVSVDDYLQLVEVLSPHSAARASAGLAAASLYVKRGLRLQQVPGLIRQFMDQGSKASDSDELSDWYQKTAAWDTLVDAYIQLKELDQARKTLAIWGEALEIRKKSVPTGSVEESRHYEALSKLALVENSQVDALAFYQVALRKVRGNSPLTYEEQLTKKASDLWKEQNRSLEDWDAWLRNSFAPKKRHHSRTGELQNLPDFEVTDLDGATWTKGSLAGKTTFINLWATWCGPCREELPRIEDLYRTLKNRHDVQVVTINVDEDITKVDSFIKERSYTFPVLLGKKVIDSQPGSWGIPQMLMVDAKGVMRARQVGLDGTGVTEWVRRMLPVSTSAVRQ